MTWSKLDDGIFDHPKMLRAGEDAANLYVRALVWCNKHLTDGEIPREALRVLTSKRDADKHAERLATVGLWEATADGWLVHDFHAHNPRREEVEARRSDLSAKRAEAGRRGGIRSGLSRQTEASDEANAKQLASYATKQNESPVPSRPVQTEEEKTSSPAAVAPSVLPAQATATPLALDLADPPPTKPRRAPKPPADPPPFSIGDAFEALASTAGGRFAPGLDSDWVKGIRIAVAKSVRRYPDLTAWRLVGEWLAAGGDRFRGVLGPSWAASTALADAMARAREWDATGRPSLVGATQIQSIVRTEPDAWSAAAKRNGVML